MTNTEVNQACNEIYNVYWAKYRDAVPARQDEAIWDKITAEADRLKEKYPLMIGAVSDVLAMLHQRMQKEESSDS